MDDYGNGVFSREEPEDQNAGGKFSALMIVPACAFALYSLLLFLLFLAPVVSYSEYSGLALGYSGLGNVSVNVYQADSGICTALIVFAAVSLAASLFGLLTLPLPFLNLGKKYPIFFMLGKVWRILPLLFYFLIYSFSCTLTGATSVTASAMGASSVAPALVLSFTIVFALIHIVCLLLPKFKH